MVEKILSDAKGLTIRLKKSDTLTDNVISTSLAVQQKIEAMKQVCENIFLFYIHVSFLINLFFINAWPLTIHIKVYLFSFFYFSQYKEIIDKLNKTASHRPKSVLIQKLKKVLFSN